MIAVYSHDKHLLERAAELLPPGTRTVSSWAEIERLASESRVCVLLIYDLSQADVRPQIERLRRRTRFVPTVLVTPFVRGNARVLNGIAVDEVVWWEDAPHTLRATVERAAQQSTLGRLAAWVRAQLQLDPVLKDALLTICLADPPLHGIEREVARAAHVSAATLEAKWRTAFGPARDLSLRRFVMWVRLLWAVERMATGMKEAVVAQRLGVDVRTLTRTATTLTRSTLHTLVLRGAPVLFGAILDVHEPQANDG